MDLDRSLQRRRIALPGRFNELTVVDTSLASVSSDADDFFSSLSEVDP